MMALAESEDWTPELNDHKYKTTALNNTPVKTDLKYPNASA
jgi:hypothetical protein